MRIRGACRGGGGLTLIWASVRATSCSSSKTPHGGEKRAKMRRCPLSFRNCLVVCSTPRCRPHAACQARLILKYSASIRSQVSVLKEGVAVGGTSKTQKLVRTGAFDVPSAFQVLLEHKKRANHHWHIGCARCTSSCFRQHKTYKPVLAHPMCQVLFRFFLNTKNVQTTTGTSDVPGAFEVVSRNTKRTNQY